MEISTLGYGDGWYGPLCLALFIVMDFCFLKRAKVASVEPEERVEQFVSPTPAPREDRIAELEAEVGALKAKVRRLRDAGKSVIGQRDEWKSRSLAAEQLLELERRRPSKVDERFDALRRLVAKELHPDFCNGGDLEKLLRAECFKKLWPEIERLAGQRG